MVEHAHLLCPNCEHDLKVRLEYNGRKIACNYCDHVFRVEIPVDKPELPVQFDPAQALEIERLARELDAAHAERARLQPQIENLAFELQTEKTERARLNAIEALQLQQAAELTQLETTLSSAQTDAEQLRAHAADLASTLKATSTDLEHERNERAAERIALRADLEREQAASQQKLAADSETERNRLEAELRAEAERQLAQERLDWQSQFEQIQLETEKIRQQRTDQDEELLRFSELLGARAAECSVLRNQFASLEARHAELKEAWQLAQASLAAETTVAEEKDQPDFAAELESWSSAIMTQRALADELHLDRERLKAELIVLNFRFQASVLENERQTQLATELTTNLQAEQVRISQHADMRLELDRQRQHATELESALAGAAERYADAEARWQMKRQELLAAAERENLDRIQELEEDLRAEFRREFEAHLAAVAEASVPEEFEPQPEIEQLRVELEDSRNQAEFAIQEQQRLEVLLAEQQATLKTNSIDLQRLKKLAADAQGLQMICANAESERRIAIATSDQQRGVIAEQERRLQGLLARYNEDHNRWETQRQAWNEERQNLLQSRPQTLPDNDGCNCGATIPETRGPSAEIESAPPAMAPRIEIQFDPVIPSQPRLPAIPEPNRLLPPVELSTAERDGLSQVFAEFKLPRTETLNSRSENSLDHAGQTTQRQLVNGTVAESNSSSNSAAVSADPPYVKRPTQTARPKRAPVAEENVKRKPTNLDNRECQYCYYREVVPAALRWYEWPLFVVNMRPFICQHCESRQIQRIL